MRRRTVVIVLSVLVCILGLSWWLFNNQAERNIGESVNAEPGVEPVVTLASTATNEPKSKKEDDVEEFNPYESEVFKGQLQQIADLYEETSKYPIGSQPVFNPDAVKEPEPFEFTEVDLPFPESDGDENPIRLAAATDTYQYFQGDLIQTRVQISGAPTDTFIGVTGTLSGANGDIPLPLNFQATNSSLTEFTANFDTNLAPNHLMTTEMLVKLTAKVGDRDLFTTVSFRYDIPSAQIIGVMPARVEGANMVIPLQVNVGQSGYYFLRGVLEDKLTRRPLIELQNEGPLLAGNGLLNLNAHISALTLQQSEGPYILRSVRLHRGAEQGETFDSPGSTYKKEYQIQGFPFSSYDNEEFVDELSQERLAFLRQMGAIDEEQVNEPQVATTEQSSRTEEDDNN
ncbi:hypothetical protein NBRC116583_05270 [Arenicella sp. 4NH20-0111]|uniref:hypothetical protein n=1 Tax=Arenicella sp. 4NH20-0111 TaxID=3127648 RepID=UPI003107009D